MTSYATDDASVQLPTIVGGMHAPAGFHEPASVPPHGACGIVQSTSALLVPVTTQRTTNPVKPLQGIRASPGY